jgi:hypothetical protein
VQFDIEAAVPGGSVRQVFWDFGDESFSSQAAPKHVFVDAGRQYPVGVSIIDDNGLWAYDVASVNCDLDKVSFPQAEAAADIGTVLLYHFNGNLDDASGHGLNLTADTKQPERRPYRFSSEAPRWMARPSGSCLVLDGAEQLRVTIPPQLLPNPATTPLTVEMMLYLREFSAWGYPGNPVLLGLAGESALGLRQGTWDRSRQPTFGKAVSSDKFAREFPRERWCQVKIVYDGQGQSQLLVDGVLWGTSSERPFKAVERKPLVFTIGPLRGTVDEVRLHCGP